MHTCGESYCTNCTKYYHSEEEVHQCYTWSIPSKQNEISKRFIFYDFESMLLKLGMHHPILVISHSICGKYANDPWVKLKNQNVPIVEIGASHVMNGIKINPSLSANLAKIVVRGKWYSVGLTWLTTFVTGCFPPNTEMLSL